LILAFLVFLNAPLRADSIPEIVAKAKPAVVEIVTADATGDAKKSRHWFFCLIEWIGRNKPACD